MGNLKMALYAVPYNKNINSGPMVRISSIKKEIEKQDGALIIVGDGLFKIKQAIQLKSNDILYVESSTNRIKFADLISLLLLKLKSKKVIVYIRDVYVEVFPNEFQSFRKKATAFFNKLTNKFYGLIATEFAFPTYEMGNTFFKKNNIKKRTMIELPPACDNIIFKASEKVAKKRVKEIKVMYLGGIGYKYSGIENFFDLIKKSPMSYKFYIVTYDESIQKYLNDLDNLSRKKVQLLSMNKEEVEKFIEEEYITFLFHSRPINEYDNLTYPIKFFDALTWNLPILTAKNIPITKIFGENYPFYVNVTSPEEIIKVIDENMVKYYDVLQNIEQIALKNRYENRIKNLKDKVIK